MENIAKILAQFRLHFDDEKDEKSGRNKLHILSNQEKTQNAKTLVEALLQSSDQHLSQSLTTSVGKKKNIFEEF